MIPAAFSRSDYILPPRKDLLQKVPHVSHRNIAPKTSESRVSCDGMSSVFRRPFCQSPPFLPLVPVHTAVPECADTATRRRPHGKPSSATLTAGLTRIRLFFHRGTHLHLTGTPMGMYAELERGKQRKGDQRWKKRLVRGTEVPQGNTYPCKAPGATFSACSGGAWTPSASALSEPCADGDGLQWLLPSLAGLTPGPCH